MAAQKTVVIGDFSERITHRTILYFTAIGLVGVGVGVGKIDCTVQFNSRWTLCVVCRS